MSDKFRRLVYLFDEVGELGSKELGGKGAGLAEMVKSGLPVPPGFIVLTGVSRAYRQEGRLPSRLDGQVKRAIALLEKRIGRTFGSGNRPLLLSVRSGAPVSMPGMMDTVLNLGLNEDTLLGLIKEIGDEEFGWNTYQRFLEQFEATVGVLVPADPWQQLQLAIEAVCRSWGSERAVEYRKAHGIPDHLGTAVVVQAMVFGNASGCSGSGVVFSRNVATGEPGLYGEYLPNGQGEELVAGTRTPEPIAALAIQSPKLYRAMAQQVRGLEVSHGDVVDVEFTVERGRLYLLQSRAAKRTPLAAMRIAVDLVHEGRLNKKEAVKRLPVDMVEVAERPQFDPEAFATAAGNGSFFAKGLPASGGSATGKAVFCPKRAQEMAKAGDAVVLVRQDTNPDDFAGMLAASAIITANGGTTCHAAVVARGLGRPAVVGISGLTFSSRSATYNGRTVKEGETISVDGATGTIVLGAIPFREGVQDEKVTTFLEWVEEIRPRPKLRWELVGEEKWSVNTLHNEFYLADALRQALADSPLKRRVLALYRKVEREIADLFSAYLVVAIAGELRHAWARLKTEDWAAELALLEGLGVCRTKQRRDVQLAVINKLRALTLQETLAFLEAGVAVFRNNGSGWGGSYGGEKWAVIAETLLDYLRGRYGAGVFVDRAFDLQHNGGRVFDKHPMVREKSDMEGLSAQLELKRHISDPGELWIGLSEHASASPALKMILQEWGALTGRPHRKADRPNA